MDKFSKDDIIVSPSILSANFSKLGEQVRSGREPGAWRQRQLGWTSSWACRVSRQDKQMHSQAGAGLHCQLPGVST